ncbi:hypothetical protein FUAX_05240 [Fulvitalea axinellae]|uniref:SMI1/KNR4 family protein n=1 Tax=Fulvitalea axinellae TaxID=1182444 RepID=A0AAU9CRV7_9BACT|nr:hypothetical protein FUAX_05240 [Fulvitalea axinellae]
MISLDEIKLFLGDENIEIETSQGKFILCKADEIQEFYPKIYSYGLDDEREYFTPKGKDPKKEHGIYTGKAINLMKNSEYYDPLGVLMYLPDLKMVGTWDGGHYQIGVFQGVTWKEISADLSSFIVSMWGNRNFDNILEVFEPWDKWEFKPTEIKEEE